MKANMQRITGQLRYLLLGIALTIGILFMMGNAPVAGPVLDNGRYQVSSYATRLGEDTGAVGAFIVDTVSGEVKTVYMRVYGDVPESKILMNNLKRNFANMQ